MTSKIVQLAVEFVIPIILLIELESTDHDMNKSFQEGEVASHRQLLNPTFKPNHRSFSIEIIHFVISHFSRIVISRIMGHICNNMTDCSAVDDNSPQRDCTIR